MDDQKQKPMTEGSKDVSALRRRRAVRSADAVHSLNAGTEKTKPTVLDSDIQKEKTADAVTDTPEQSFRKTAVRLPHENAADIPAACSAPMSSRKTNGARDAAHTAGKRGGTPLLFFAVLLILITASVFGYRLLAGQMQTAAVMVYADDTPIGYLAWEDREETDARCRRAMEAVLGMDLDDSITDALPNLQWDSVSYVEKNVLLSDDALCDGLFAALSDGYVRGCVIRAQDGEMLACAASEDILLSAADRAEAILSETIRSRGVLPSDAEIRISRRFTCSDGWAKETTLLSEGALLSEFCRLTDGESAYFTIDVMRTECVPVLLPYETTYIENDDAFDGVTTLVSSGLDGLCSVTYTVFLDAETGAELSRTETERTVIRAPQNAVSYEGIYPLPDGVSTGSMNWPLPDLPDDDLPLDENGVPYMPENPLALKNTYVSSVYGGRSLWGAYDFHLGIDIVAPAYTEIFACDGGVVVYAAYSASYGYMTRIRHDNGLETVYAHQAKQAVKAGDIVEQGQVIGYVGATGNTSGCHLHLEVRKNHVTVDPREYVTIPEAVLVLDTPK